MRAPIRAKVSSEELAVFTREFATMHAAGISLVRAVEFYADSGTTDLSRVCDDVAIRMRAGCSLSHALRQYPDIFSDVYVSLVEAGEASGELRDILHKLADLQERSRKMRQRVLSTLTYPMVLLLAGMASLAFFVFVVLPSMLPLFESLNLKLPWMTWALASLGASLRRPLAWVVVALAGVGVWQGGRLFARRLRTDGRLRRRVEGFILKLPVAGPVISKLVTARMMYTVSTLMQAGVFLESALLKAGKVSGNLVFLDRMQNAVDDISDGELMSTALARYNVFPRAVLQIVAASEESGGLVNALQRASIMFEEDVEMALASLSALMEPVILLAMGVVSAFVVLSVILPTVQLLNNL